jgi:hypothetical protein
MSIISAVVLFPDGFWGIQPLITPWHRHIVPWFNIRGGWEWEVPLIHTVCTVQDLELQNCSMAMRLLQHTGSWHAFCTYIRNACCH